jgi:hypothetical protein
MTPSPLVQRVEKVLVRYQVEAFRVTVKDLSGAALPGASIVVVKRGSRAKDILLMGKADAKGDFSGQLADGSYVAVFFSRGFRPAIEPFDVAKAGSSELSVSLDVGHCP